MEVNVHQAKTDLSKLILKAEAGEEIMIARAGKAVVRLVPIQAARRKVYKPGALKGSLQLPAALLDPDAAADAEMERLFHEAPLVSPTEALAKRKAEAARR